MVTTYQYPQYLYASRNEQAIQNPNTGSWDTKPAVWELKGICREETNGKGHTIATANGQTIVFSSLIQIPAGTPRINEGAEIAVTREEINPDELLNADFRKQGKINGTVIVTGKCMKYDYGRLHCRLWI